MMPSSSGGMSDESGSEDDEDRPPLNLHINQHSNLYKYNNQFTVAKRPPKKNGHAQQGHSNQPVEDCEDSDRPDTPIQVA